MKLDILANYIEKMHEVVYAYVNNNSIIVNCNWHKTSRQAHGDYLAIKEALKEYEKKNNIQLNINVLSEDTRDNNKEVSYKLKITPINNLRKDSRKNMRIRYNSVKRYTRDSVSVSEIANFIYESATSLLRFDDNSTYSYRLASGLAIVVGYLDGFGKEKRDDVLQSKSNPNYGIVVGIREYTNGFNATDIDLMDCPEINGEPYCIDVYPNKKDLNDKCRRIANYLLRETKMIEDELNKDINDSISKRHIKARRF